MRRDRSRALVLAVGLTAITSLASAAGAAPSAVDITLTIGASTQLNPAPLVPNGGTTTVTSRNFYAFVNVDLLTPAPGGRPTVLVELGGGLRWGEDNPDPGEDCTSTPTTGQCRTPDLQPTTGMSGGGWYWDVVAPGNGTYRLSAAIVDAPEPDPDPSNNAATITIVVDEPTGGGSGGSGGSGGAGGGGGTTVAAKASSVTLSPTRPKAGSTVVASVRVTKGGSSIRPTRIVCSASIGGAKVKGGPRAASGVAACLFKTPKTGKGKTLGGSISFRAAGTAFTKRFATRLR